MSNMATISARADRLREEIAETEWAWRSLDQQEWWSGGSAGQSANARAKRELEAEAGLLRAALAVVLAGRAT